MSWTIVEHTADLAIEAEGPSREAVLADAATAIASIVTGKDDPRWFGTDAEFEAIVEAPDPEALAVAWLSEVLWMLSSQDILWITGGLDIGTSEDGGLRLEARGNAVHYDPARHGRGVEVKAVTYHDLVLAHQGGRWRLHVLLDI